MEKNVSKGIKNAVAVLGDELIAEINQIFAMAENLPAGSFQQFSCDCMLANIVAITEDGAISLWLVEEILAKMKKSA